MNTRVPELAVPLETLVRAAGASPGVVLDGAGHDGAGHDERSILQLAAGRFVSIAELSAHLQLPPDLVGARIVSLYAARRVQLHAPPVLPYNPAPVIPGAGPATTSPVLTPTVLECVLDGLAAL